MGIKIETLNTLLKFSMANVTISNFIKGLQITTKIIFIP